MATLITGGAGFIGLAVVRLLIAQGEHRPVIFSPLSAGVMRPMQGGVRNKRLKRGKSL